MNQWTGVTTLAATLAWQSGTSPKVVSDKPANAKKAAVQSVRTDLVETFGVRPITFAETEALFRLFSRKGIAFRMVGGRGYVSISVHPKAVDQTRRLLLAEEKKGRLKVVRWNVPNTRIQRAR